MNYPSRQRMKQMIQACDETRRTKPENALYAEHQVEQQDIIILGSDGFFDNVWPHEVCEVLNFCQKKISDPQEFCEYVSQILVELSYIQGQSSQKVSPFQKAAEQNGQSFQGGKPDDTTVIVTLVAINS